ncbi:hypothetical protein [Parvularcula maris]|uniref:Glycosyltransferase family 2 protein n=1 Tax=Parvularcula maris TaxID=2965077 RepID=A0A9X2LA82_9PROT|nr:hypothetical protein [Parvularcula maris]MCQ8186010.1 hypothetical protein [Parvularcula maris]
MALPPEGQEERAAAELDASLVPGRYRAPPDAAWRADDIVLRQLALAKGLAFEADDPDAFSGHKDQVAEGTLRAHEGRRPPQVSVIILTRADDRRAEEAAGRAAEIASEVVLVVDAEKEEPLGFDPRGARVIRRLLAGDFAAQRNTGQAAASHPYTLHLDTDEALQVGREDLSLLCSLMQRDGLRAVGFPRRNMVDGQLSALYPDVQYRLLRRDERFEGRVHERPRVCSEDWTRTTIAFGLGMEHRLSGEHVRARRERYDALGQGAERRAEARLLSAPFPREER